MRELLPIKSHAHLFMWSCERSRDQLKPLYLLYHKRPMCTRCGRAATYFVQLLSIKPNGLFILWSCEVTWQTKNTSPLQQCIWPPKQNGYIQWTLFHKVTLQGHVINWICYISAITRHKPLNLARWWLITRASTQRYTTP